MGGRDWACHWLNMTATCLMNNLAASPHPTAVQMTSLTTADCSDGYHVPVLRTGFVLLDNSSALKSPSSCARFCNSWIRRSVLLLWQLTSPRRASAPVFTPVRMPNGKNILCNLALAANLLPGLTCTFPIFSGHMQERCNLQTKRSAVDQLPCCLSPQMRSQYLNTL
jgi:hypothetical protein